MKQDGIRVHEPAHSPEQAARTRAAGGSDHRRRVWSVDEAAVMLGISRAHAYELVARNDLAHVRLGRRILIPVDVVDRLLDVGRG